MAPTAGEFRSFVGVEGVYIARITQDDAAGYVAATPSRFSPVIAVGKNVEQGSETQYADDVPYDSVNNEGPTVLTLSVTGIPAEIYAEILGKVFDVATGQVFETPGSSPDFALGFKALKANGSFRYYWFYKGKFSIPNESLETKTATPAFQPSEIIYTALYTVYAFDVGDENMVQKGLWGDEDTLNFSETDFFTTVRTPTTASIDALALSVADPVDGAAAVAVTKTIVLTFNNALTDDAINHVTVVKSDGAAAASTNSLDATKKILTVNPNASLDASSTYIVTYGVDDIYDQSLNGALNFGTA